MSTGGTGKAEESLARAVSMSDVELVFVAVGFVCAFLMRTFGYIYCQQSAQVVFYFKHDLEMT
jgi:hypothetical protein